MKQSAQTATLATGSVTHVGQIPNVLACAHFLATTPLLAEKAVFVVMEDAADRHVVASAMPLFDTGDGRGRAVQEWDGDRFAVDALRFLKGVVVCDARTLEETLLPAPSSFERSCLQLSVGDTMRPLQLKEFLVNEQYESEHSANVAGRWAARGAVVDVYVNAPVRIEFEGNTVASIAEFDLADGRAVKSLPSVVLPSLRARGRSTILDFLPQDAVVVWMHADPAAAERAQIVLDPFMVDGGLNAGYVETRAYHLRIPDVVQDVTAAHDVFALTSSPQRVKGLLGDASGSARVKRFEYSGAGFEQRDAGVLVLTDTAIGLVEEKSKQRARKVQEAMIRALAVGDIVVHQHHGIARFAGASVQHVNELDREYFVLEYAGNDKIYVPVEMADRVEKYVGDPNPTVHKLSDASWHEAVRRVQEHSLEFARELLDQYAQRSASKSHRFAQYNEEQELDAQCEFTLTTDQEQALVDVFHDLEQEQPMDRLLCGDVGFGKTEVAVRAAFRAVLNGYQVTVLAPTTVLAQQHLDTFHSRLDGFGVKVAGLSRMQSSTEQRAAVDGVRSGAVDIVVGTHRVTSADVDFKRLGLIVIDEEQRFGVRAKERLKKMRSNVHVLTMTATPIPRTLHLSLTGIRNISTILTPPNERKAVHTVIQPMNNDLVREAIEREIARGGQVYYVYNRVESIEMRRRQLQTLLPNARIGVGHGQLPVNQLASVMHQFDVGEIDVLLATTIVENGLDIPNANTLIVENASMFGLGELYQLKGRVGRSERQGYAYFLYNEQRLGGDVRRRFIALQEADALGAGFELAMKDMEIRGVGNILGKEQHGHAVKIGMNLYLRLLNQAVQQLQGAEQMTLRDVRIDLPLEARIPDNVVPNETDRVFLYQQLASITDEEALERKQAELTDDTRFLLHSALHPSLQGLFDLLRIKVLAAHSSLLSIDTTHPTDANGLDSSRITLTADQPFVGLPPEWEVVRTPSVKGTRARASVAALGPDWPHALQALIRSLKREPEAEVGAVQRE